VVKHYLLRHGDVAPPQRTLADFLGSQTYFKYLLQTIPSSGLRQLYLSISIYLSIDRSIYLSLLYPSLYPPISMAPSISLSLYLSIYLYISIYLSSIYLCILSI
jgi:hypothetical protein